MFVASLLRKVIKKSNLGPICLFLNPHRCVQHDDKSVDLAKNFLNAYSADPSTSCVTKNNIDIVADLHIVVPAYNVEKYICQCIDSIVLPAKKISYSLTIINDGSVDGTCALLQNYKDIPEVEIIDQKNKGFSGARNAGLKNIKGRYITFVDSDDWVEWSVLEEMVLKADQVKSEMIEAGFFNVDTKGNLINRKVSVRNRFTGFPCGKVFIAEKWKHICFPVKYWFEDTIIEQILFEQLDNKQLYDKRCYYYRQNPNGITATCRKKNKSIDSVWILLSLHKDRISLGLPLSQEYYEFVLRHIYLTFNRIALQGSKVKKSCFLLLSDFVNKVFIDYHTEDGKIKRLEKAIRSYDYGKGIAFCEYIKI